MGQERCVLNFKMSAELIHTITPCTTPVFGAFVRSLRNLECPRTHTGEASIVGGLTSSLGEEISMVTRRQYKLHP